jgi:hypothetical protein
MRLVPPPFHPARLQFLRRAGVTENRRDHLEAAMLVKWRAGKLVLRGRKSSTVPWYSVEDLVGHLVRVPGWEIEGDAELKGLRLPGDVVVRGDASPEECRMALEQIVSRQLGKKVSLELRDVERPVTVLKGVWRYTPVADRAVAGGPPMLELYDTHLTPPADPGGEADTTVGEAAAGISAYVGKDVLIECAGAPERLRMRENAVGEGGRAHDPTRALRRVEEQTGLSAVEEKRRVRRLMVSAK